ncbi:MAG: S8 family serine peptidase [Bacteroidetes bacterium]|nr:S8 family serine peptidase [Bacteroidota bacterium]
MKKFLLLYLFFSGLIASGQNKYFIYLKDKTGSSFSINKPEEFLSARSINRRKTQKIAINLRDIPVNKTYIDQIITKGAKVLGKSKWLNAVLIAATETQLNEIKKLSFVSSVEGNGDIKGARIGTTANFNNKFGTQEDYNYGNSLNQIQQIGADKMHKAGFTGKGILIAILDSGFEKAINLEVFKHLVSENKIIMTYDFVDQESDVYDDHNHGTSVLSCIAAKSPGKLYGTAPDASIALFRTEDVSSETKIEEVNWLLAAEKADSLGADVINSSLGYYEFDNPKQNYVYTDMDGNKTISAKAADFAVGVGIIVVVSAGNEGNTAWKYISTPADADSVISVGAVDVGGNPAGFSSFGPGPTGTIKPEVAARGSSTVLAYPNNTIGASNGTSFSSPIMAGFCASLKQEFPTLTALQMREVIIKSASKYETPDTRVGYGIPNYDKAAELAEKLVKNPLGVEVQEFDLTISPNPFFNNSEITISGLEPKPDAEYFVIDYSGKTVFTKKDLKKLNESLQKLPAGNYILKVKSEEKFYSGKIVKSE